VNQLVQHPENPLHRGKEKIWAASIAHAVGSINLLFQQESQPHVSIAELNQYFGTNQTTTGSKSITLRDLLHISPYNTDYQINPTDSDNPLEKIKEIIIKKFGISEADVEAILRQAGHPDSPIIPKTNYSAISIIPKQKFWDWVATQTNLEDLPPEMKKDHNIYLIPEIDLDASLENELHEVFEEIWKIELTRYINLETEYPEANFLEFFQWFEVRSSSHVMDLTGELLDDFNEEDFFDEDLGPKDKNKPPGFTLN